MFENLITRIFDFVQAIVALKKGAYIESTDEKTLMWFSGKDGKHLHISSVRSIIRGHQTLSVYQDNYGPRGNPKLCPFRLSTDEKTLMWFSVKDEKHLHLSSVTRIIRGHQVRRKVQLERESHLFSLIYMTNQAQYSLDLIESDEDVLWRADKEKVERDREREREREKDKSKHKEKKNEDVADGRRDEEKIRV
ncbi:hypothetical protein Tco_1156500 [Tanacetum coccineum]